MSVQAHIDSNFGAVTPTGGYVNESKHDDKIKKYEVYDEGGVKQRLRGGKHIESGVDINGKGGADYSVIAPGAFTEGAFKAMSAETTEYNEGEYCDFVVAGEINDTVPA